MSSQEQTSVLLSIRPAFAEAILAGTKTFEFRRRIFRDLGVRRIILYASSPIGKVVGEFEVETVLNMEPRKLWAATSRGAGISRAYFDSYFDGRSAGYALKIRNPKRYIHPLDLDSDFGIAHPPQSFRYVAELPPTAG